MRAVLALDGFDSKKHSGVISEFRRVYVKTGKFSVQISDIIRDAFIIRNDSDYEDFFIITNQEVLQQLENAKVFLEEVKIFLRI